MIHQFIFAGPRPGWVAKRFQDYWLQQHSIHYAAKIRQIRQYLVGLRIRLEGMPSEVPFFEGVAEIWIREEDQIASLLSDEFLKGARADEPCWAAFWQTFVHESNSEIMVSRANSLDSLFKLYFFLKRRSSLDLATFRGELRASIRDQIHPLPSLAEYVSAPARDSLYGFGEPRFDSIEILAFSSARDCRKALASGAWKEFTQSLSNIVEERFLFNFLAQENWIIRPGERPWAGHLDLMPPFSPSR